MNVCNMTKTNTHFPIGCFPPTALDFFEKLKQEKTLANVTSEDNY